MVLGIKRIIRVRPMKERNPGEGRQYLTIILLLVGQEAVGSTFLRLSHSLLKLITIILPPSQKAAGLQTLIITTLLSIQGAAGL